MTNMKEFLFRGVERIHDLNHSMQLDLMVICSLYAWFMYGGTFDFFWCLRFDIEWYLGL